MVYDIPWTLIWSWRLLWGPTRLLWGARAYLVAACGLYILACTGMSSLCICINSDIHLHKAYKSLYRYVHIYTRRKPGIYCLIRLYTVNTRTKPSIYWYIQIYTKYMTGLFPCYVIWPGLFPCCINSVGEQRLTVCTRKPPSRIPWFYWDKAESQPLLRFQSS